MIPGSTACRVGYVEVRTHPDEMVGRPRWTTEEDQQLKELYAATPKPGLETRCLCRSDIIDPMSIDHESPVAPYRQVAAILRGRITAGEITVRLPSIADLTQEFGIARATAAKALKMLVDEGVAEVSPGMGTFLVRRSELS